MRYPLHNYIHV